MAALVVRVGWAVVFEAGVRFTDARRASITILGVMILGVFSLGWAALWGLFQLSALLVVLGRFKKTKLVLGFAASKPMESHIHGFCASGLYVVVYDSKGCTVVGLHGSWGLFVAHFC